MDPQNNINQEPQGLDEQRLSQPNSVPPQIALRPKKSKRPLVIAVVVLLLVVASAGTYVLMKGTDKQSIKTTPTAKETQAKGRPFDQIDAQLAQYRIDAEKNPRYKDEASKWSNYLGLAYLYNDANNFALTTPKQKNVYKLQDISTSELQGDNYCTPLNEKWSSKVTDAKNIFEKAGYKVIETQLYSQFDNCNKELIAYNDTEACSLFYGLTANAGETLDIGVSCSPLSELTDEVAHSKEVHRIFTDTGIDQPAGSQLVANVTYIKDSNTSGYRIASLSQPLDIYYYKKGGGKWVVVEAEGGLKCATKDPEVKVAFKGQECSTESGEPQIL